jgi:hypothetical protein
LKGFPLDCLSGATVVAVNDAVFKLPWAAAVVSVDSTWIQRRQRDLDWFQGERYFGIESGMEDLVQIPATLLVWKNSQGLTTDPKQLYSPCSSGYAALNLAFLKYARRIVLLGYDYRNPGSHWFGDYAWTTGADDQLYELWAQMYDSTRFQLQRARVEVVNANLESAITAFPKSSLTEVKDELERTHCQASV